MPMHPLLELQCAAPSPPGDKGILWICSFMFPPFKWQTELTEPHLSSKMWNTNLNLCCQCQVDKHLLDHVCNLMSCTCKPKSWLSQSRQQTSFRRFSFWRFGTRWKCSKACVASTTMSLHSVISLNIHQCCHWDPLTLGRPMSAEIDTQICSCSVVAIVWLNFWQGPCKQCVTVEAHVGKGVDLS